ncbi:MAG: hypothetical protein RLZZ248_197 [Bacteroidota bacterium]
MYLNCHTFYSMRYGTLSPQELVDWAAQNSIATLALTDINNTSGAFEFIQRCQAVDIQPVLGIDFRNKDGVQYYIGLARNPEGFRQLNAFLTQYAAPGQQLPPTPPLLPDCWIIYPLGKNTNQLAENELIGIRLQDVNNFSLRKMSPEHLGKLVLLHAVSFGYPEDYQTHKLLRAIDLNTLITKIDATNSAHPNEWLQTPATLLKAFEAFPEIIQQTEFVLSTCHIDIPSGLHNNKRYFTGGEESDFRLLEKLTDNGKRKRYGLDNPLANERIKKELSVIRRQSFCAYFLITWDIIRYAQSVGYHHVGRGSGANSIVAFCLGITDVDPLELDLYFERFINPYRSSPPDFDIDFSWDERDDITDYIFKRYGSEHTALLATYNTFKGRSIIRELGKVYGLPKQVIDRIVDMPEDMGSHHDLAAEIIHQGKKIEGLPNYLSIHAGGVLISERPIHYYTALQWMPKGFPITHFDMHHAEDMGFHKLDVLSQRGLGHIKDSIALIKRNYDIDLDIHQIQAIKQDPKVKAQLQSGQCMGCFYIESPAMRGLLHKLRCDDYIQLVAASSIIRPGVSSSGMMREFIQRFHQPDSFEYIHPIFEQHLGETYGVMVYQEDVMKILHHFAGLDLDESDVLRRIMCGKKAKGDTPQRLEKKYYDNCRARGYSDELSKEVWRQIESFSGYSFCKAHSASFAVESLQSLYLKAYYPLEFMVAVINNFGGFYSTEYYFHEARMCGATIHAPCVNHSRYHTDIDQKDIYIGFIHLQGMERAVGHQIVHQRLQGGAFTGLEDFINRVHIGAEQLEILIRIGAFRFIGKKKYELMWEKNALMRSYCSTNNIGNLFEERTANWQLPVDVFEEHPLDQHFDEIELLGFTLCSPFELLEPNSISPKILLTAAHQLRQKAGQFIYTMGYFVCRKTIRTKSGQPMEFGTWIDPEGQFFDTTHFNLRNKKNNFTGKGIYLIKGKVTLDFNFPNVEVIAMKRLPMVKDERF